MYWIVDPDVKKQAMQDFLEGPYPIFLRALDKRLESRKFITCNDKLSCADFLLAGVIYTVIYNEHKAPDWDVLRIILEKHQNVKRYAQTMKEELGDYLETRPKCPR